MIRIQWIPAFCRHAHLNCQCQRCSLFNSAGRIELACFLGSADEVDAFGRQLRDQSFIQRANRFLAASLSTALSDSMEREAGRVRR